MSWGVTITLPMLGGRSILVVRRSDFCLSSILACRHSVDGAPLRGGGLPWVRGLLELPLRQWCLDLCAKAAAVACVPPETEATVGGGKRKLSTLTLKKRIRRRRCPRIQCPSSHSLGLSLPAPVSWWWLRLSSLPGRLGSPLSSSNSDYYVKTLMPDSKMIQWSLPPQIGQRHTLWYG